MRGSIRLVLLLSVGLAALGCQETTTDKQQEPTRPIKRATAIFHPKSGSELYGSAIFINEGQQVTIQVSVENVEPGVHAVHIHETGDCSAEDGTSAGGHWNPTGAAHGEWDNAPFHLGDVGNMTVGENGEGALTLTTDRWSMGGGAENDIMGKAVIVHAAADDFTTQPTGAAGGRIGCGVIEKG